MLALGPVARMTSPKGPSLVVREFAGSGLFTGQYARLVEQPVFRKMRRERPDRRSWRSGQQLNQEADRVPFTKPILRLSPPGNNPFFRLSLVSLRRRERNEAFERDARVGDTVADQRPVQKAEWSDADGKLSE